MRKKPLILVTNDDGVSAPGLRKLILIMKQIGNVVVIAPDKPMSGMSHSVTMTVPIRLLKIEETSTYKEYACSGTPVDCVKMGLKIILNQKPDIIVSGINHGSNASVNVLYSGTMAAAFEGAMINVPAIGFSLNEQAYNANFDNCSSYISKIVKHTLKNGLPKYTCLNVNFPNSEINIKGIKITRQAIAYWDEDFLKKTDPHGRDYFWLSGVFRNTDDSDDTDDWAIRNGYVSITPMQFDMTAFKAMSILKNFENI